MTEDMSPNYPKLRGLKFIHARNVAISRQAGHRSRSRRKTRRHVCPGRLHSPAPEIVSHHHATRLKAPRDTPCGPNVTTATWKTSSRSGRNFPEHRQSTRNHSLPQEERSMPGNLPSIRRLMISSCAVELSSPTAIRIRSRHVRGGHQAGSKFCSGLRRYRTCVGGMDEFRSPNPEYVQKGLAACARAEWLAPDLADVSLARARIEYAQHHYDQAIALARRAVEQQPECEGAHDVLGRAYFSAGRYEDGAALWRTVPWKSSVMITTRWFRSLILWKRSAAWPMRALAPPRHGKFWKTSYSDSRTTCVLAFSWLPIRPAPAKLTQRLCT